MNEPVTAEEVAVEDRGSGHSSPSHDDDADAFPKRRKLDGEIAMPIKFPRRDFFKTTPKQYLAEYSQRFKMTEPIYTVDTFENGKLYHAQCTCVLYSLIFLLCSFTRIYAGTMENTMRPHALRLEGSWRNRLLQWWCCDL